MIPLLATAIVNRPDLLQRLISSIDFPVGELLVIDNGRDNRGHLDIPTCVGKLTTIYNGSNMGCAGAWNQSINHAFNERRYEYLLIMGNDIQLTPGDLEKLHKAITPDTDFVSGNWAFSSWGLTRNGFGKLGWVDENIHPAYGEDVDLWRRVQLHGGINITSVDTHMIHGEAPTWGSSTIYSDPDLRRKNHVTHGRNLSYLERKWNWDRNKPMETATYTRPFNDQSKPLWHWELSPDRIQQPHFRTNG
jgi:GT2 family glycosyltransferase